MIIEKVFECKKSKMKQWPVRSNRASELGHECLRYLVFNRTRWQEKALPDPRLQIIFEEGNLHEQKVLQDIQEAGFQVVEQQRPFEWKEYQITGHIDAKVVTNGKAIPLEIKSASPYSFNSINSLQDLYNGKYPYLRRYPAQMTLYLLMDEKEEGLFIFKNKATGELKEISMKLNYDLGETLLQKAEAINKHVANGTIPEPIEYDEENCGSCGFLHICLPEVKRDAIQIETDNEMEQKLVRYHELKPLIKEYNQLDKEIKKAFKEKEKVVIGNYLITGKWIKRKAYAVQAGQYWQMKIQKLEG